ncbi:hypothetical protein Tco_0394314 [Tanacetum coccineum]
MPRDCLRIIESKSKVRNSRNKPVVAKVSSSTSTPGISSEVAELKDMVKALLLDKKNQSPAPTPVKAVEESCVTCGGAHSYQTCPATTGNVYRDNIQEYVSSQQPHITTIQGNTIIELSDFKFKFDLHRGFSKFVNIQYRASTSELSYNTVTNRKEDLKVTKDTMPPTNNESTEDAPPLVVPVIHHESISKPINAPVSASRPNQKASIPFPARRNDERRREKANDQIEKFYKIFRDLSFKISFTDALMLMPKFASTLKTLIGNKEKLSEMARTPLNENCSAVLLNKFTKEET